MEIDVIHKFSTLTYMNENHQLTFYYLLQNLRILFPALICFLFICIHTFALLVYLFIAKKKTLPAIFKSYCNI